MPGLLAQAVVPSPSFCCSAGLRGSPPCCSRASQVETAPTPAADPADVEDRRVLGEDNPQAPGPGLDEGCPTCPWGGLSSCASPALLQPAARSPELHPPSLPSRTEPPRALLQAPLPSPHPAGGRGLSTPGSPLPVALSEPQPHRAPGWEMGMAWAGKGYAGCCEEGLVRPPAEGL